MKFHIQSCIVICFNVGKKLSPASLQIILATFETVGLRIRKEFGSIGLARPSEAAMAANGLMHQALVPMFFCPSIFRMTQLGSLGYAAMSCQTVISGKKKGL